MHWTKKISVFRRHLIPHDEIWIWIMIDVILALHKEGPSKNEDGAETATEETHSNNFQVYVSVTSMDHFHTRRPMWRD